MDKREAVIAKLKELAPEGKITCTEARQVAVDFDLDSSEVGKICDEIEVKIYACELGCF